MVKRFLIYGFPGLLAVLLLLLVLALAPLDRRPYQDMPYYHQSLQGLAQASAASLRQQGDSLRVGWARQSLLPPQPWPMAGYGDRSGAPHQGVRDSIATTAFVIELGGQRVALLTADLLIVPPAVRQALGTQLPALGLSLERVFFSSTHTHGSLGAWDPSPVGERFAGPYDPEAVAHIARRMQQALARASQALAPCRLGYAQARADAYVYNRLVGGRGTEDPWLRLLVFERMAGPKAGQRALWVSFAAHATVFSGREMRLHQDYVGPLLRLLEARDGVELAAFAAGAVGSIGPEGGALSAEAQRAFMARGLYERAAAVLDTLGTAPVQQLRMLQPTLHLRAPHLRLSDDLRIRPWLFRQLMGTPSSTTYLSGLRLGDVLLLGAPCDFSGELMPALAPQGHPLMLCSFNGDYVGYITHDRWYELDSYETQLMNWYGPYNGAYFVEMMNRTMQALLAGP